MRVICFFLSALVVVGHGANPRGGNEEYLENNPVNGTEPVLRVPLDTDKIGTNADMVDWEDHEEMTQFDETVDEWNYERDDPIFSQQRDFDFEEHFSSQLTRRAQSCCAEKKADIEFFDLSIAITPTSHQTCSQADQNFLGNAINLLLLDYGVGKAGDRDDVLFLAKVCAEPSTHRRQLYLRRGGGYIWDGAGACRGCPGERYDGRRTLFTEIGDTNVFAEEFSFDTTPAAAAAADEAEDMTNTRHLAVNSYWFNNQFKPQLEGTISRAIKNQLAPKHRGCLGWNPDVNVNVIGVRASDINHYCGTSTGGTIPVLDTVGHADWVLSNGRDRCGTCIHLDFQRKASGGYFRKGDWVNKREYKNKYGLQISVSERQSRNSKEARIFDTSNPGTTYATGDRDLGSPNNSCGGPGVGDGGKRGRKGENCVAIGSKYDMIYMLADCLLFRILELTHISPPISLSFETDVLVIQDPNTPRAYPNDNRSGGTFTFIFDDPVLISDVGMMDIDAAYQRFTFYDHRGKASTFGYQGFGDNSVQRVVINKYNVKKMIIVLRGGGAVTEVNFCPNC